MIRWRILPYGFALAGCTGIQSALEPHGPHAAQISILWWIMLGGAGAILILVVAATTSALFSAPSRRRWLGRETIVVAGGLVFPIVVLTLLLAYGLAATRSAGSALPAGEPLRIAVIGEQWWWRVVYLNTSPRIETANEIRIPTGRPIELTLSTADVIHSFWVPHLAGKLDMIPGRTTTLHLSASRPGTSRGQCAEYCGGAHALMSFHVVAIPADDFETWWRRESSLPLPPTDPVAQRGEALFLSSGCGACHTVRGTGADGRIGPDLTHVGNRISIGAAVLPNDTAALARWIADNQHIKPENRMPPFRIFDDGELAALATYLAGLN